MTVTVVSKFHVYLIIFISCIFFCQARKQFSFLKITGQLHSLFNIYPYYSTIITYILNLPVGLAVSLLMGVLLPM